MKAKRSHISSGRAWKEAKAPPAPPTPSSSAQVNDQLKGWILAKPSPQEMKRMHEVLGYFMGALSQTLCAMGEALVGFDAFGKGAQAVADATGQAAKVEAPRRAVQSEKQPENEATA